MRTFTGAVIGIGCALLGLTAQANAQVTFNASGTLAGGNVSAMATFTKDTAGNLIVTLQNTSVNGASGTQNRTQLLTDLFFSVTGANPALALASGTGTAVQNGQAARLNADLVATSANKGTYQFLSFAGSTFPNNSQGMSFPYEYGLSTVGDSGLFSGNLVGNDDYAIVAPNTDISQSGLNNIALVQSAATFKLSGFSNLNLSQVSNVAFSFGSAPDLVLNSAPTNSSPASVPEPGAVAALVGMGVTGAGFLARRKRSRA